MTEYIVSGPSSAKTLEAAGMEVITRCKDCKWYEPVKHKCSLIRFAGIRPNDYCRWGVTLD